MLYSTGAAFSNKSITAKGANQFQTPVSGTIAFDTVTHAGTATLDPFPFAENGNASATSITMQAVGDGMGGMGNLVVANMNFNWGGNNGIPTSIVLDAAGFFNATNADFADGVLDQSDTAVTTYGAIPSSDGTYDSGIPVNGGYLQLGAVPIATTDWNMSLLAGCSEGVDANYADNTGGGCMGIPFSGGTPFIADLTDNPNRYDLSTTATGDLLDNGTGVGKGVGGNPMVDGPFKGFNANFDILSLQFDSQVAGSIGPFDVAAPSAIPIPAAVWLFGSGLLGLVGVARRKKAT
jgi:hypothetical protein